MTAAIAARPDFALAYMARMDVANLSSSESVTAVELR